VKSSIDLEQAPLVADARQTRRDLLRSGGIAAVAGVLSVLGISSATEAKNGGAVRIGQKNSGTRPTSLESKKGPGFEAKVGGSGAQVAVRGLASSQKGIGVQGIASASKGESVGIEGQTESPEGVAGRFVAEGGGVAVQATASSKRGAALSTKGRLKFEDRSGSATVSGGSDFVIPVAGGVSEGSLVLATLQDHVPGIHVEAASVLDVDEGLIVVRLNQAVAEPATVAWFVLD
jgi:hypothetical protein